MNGIEEELKNNVKTFWESAELIYATGDYTSATILYFKAFFVVLDYCILKKRGEVPKDHTDRFRILKIDFPTYYVVLDKYFQIYRDTYSTSIAKEICEELRDHVKRIIVEQNIQLKH